MFVTISSGCTVNLHIVWDTLDPERMKGRKQEKEGGRERGEMGRKEETKKGERKLDKERRKTGSKAGRQKEKGLREREY